MKTPLIIAALLALSACRSPQQVLADLVARNPDLVQTDTTEVQLAVPVPPDTLRSVVHLRDTATAATPRQSVRIVRVPVGSPCDTVAITLQLLGTLVPDTIYSTVRIPCDTVQAVKVVYKAPWWVVPMVGLLLIVLFLAMVRK